MSITTAPSRAALDRERQTITAAIVTVSLGESLVQFGLVPVTAVIPALAAEFGASAADGAWILTAFVLGLAGALLVSGRLGDLLGHRRLFVAGAVVYAVGSVVAGFAGALGTMIAARAVQGVGAAMVSGNNLAILVHGVPAERRARAIAIVAGASFVIGVVSTALGTLAVTAGAWPLLFLGTIPFAAWAAVRARRLPARAVELGPARIDWAGAALLVTTMTLVAVTLNHPHDSTSAAVMPLFHWWMPALALLAGAGFLAVERRADPPLLEWGALNDRVFAASIVVNTVMHMTMMGVMFLGPMLVVRGLGLGTGAGSALMMIGMTAVALAAFGAGWLNERFEADWLRPAGTALLGVGFVTSAWAGTAESYAGVVVGCAIAGSGLGIVLAVNNPVVMAALPPDVRGVASGMLETTRHIGHALGVTLSTAVLAWVMASAGAGPAGVRRGFVWACLAMTAVTTAGVLSALVRPRPAGRERSGFGRARRLFEQAGPREQP